MIKRLRDIIRGFCYKAHDRIAKLLSHPSLRFWIIQDLRIRPETKLVSFKPLFTV